MVNRQSVKGKILSPAKAGFDLEMNLVLGVARRSGVYPGYSISRLQREDPVAIPTGRVLTSSRTKSSINHRTVGL